jgi:hypothetical protein
MARAETLNRENLVSRNARKIALAGALGAGSIFSGAILLDTYSTIGNIRAEQEVYRAQGDPNNTQARRDEMARQMSAEATKVLIIFPATVFAAGAAFSIYKARRGG